jgi:hypothetical protein
MNQDTVGGESADTQLDHVHVRIRRLKEVSHEVKPEVSCSCCRRSDATASRPEKVLTRGHLFLVLARQLVQQPACSPTRLNPLSHRASPEMSLKLNEGVPRPDPVGCPAPKL